MKTIKQALIDEIFYPIPIGFVENVLIKRGISESDTFNADVATSVSYQGAVADCLYSLIQSINFSEGDKSIGSISDKDKERLLIKVNAIYSSIGEPAVIGNLQPMVYIMDNI